MEAEQSTKRAFGKFWQKYYWLGLAMLALAIIWAVRQPAVQDFWLGLGYEADAKVQEISDALELTNSGKHILKATRPVVESADGFNAHCNSHNADISLLGCYVDGKIYVYEVTAERLVAANRVTMAHELLHAIWARLDEREQREVTELLEQVYAEKQAWFDEELKAYEDKDRIEEIYTRAATKLTDLPEALERHYARYFRNRRQIVAFYEEYEAPFLELKLEMEELVKMIEQVRGEIETDKEQYLARVEALDKEIGEFNVCADQVGCFTNEEDFAEARNALLAKKTALEAERGALNQKIMENNERIEKYREQQLMLGELNDAMNSNIEPVVE